MLAGGNDQDAPSLNDVGDLHGGAGSQQHSPRASFALPGESAQPASSKASERSDRSGQAFWNPYVDSDSEIASTHTSSESGDIPSQPPQPFFSRPGNLPEQAPARPPGIWTKPTQMGSLEGEPKPSSEKPPTTAPSRPPGVFHPRPSSSSTFNLNAPEFVPQGHAAKSEPPEANQDKRSGNTPSRLLTTRATKDGATSPDELPQRPRDLSADAESSQGDPEQPVKAESPHPTPLQSSAPEFRSVPLRPPGDFSSGAPEKALSGGYGTYMQDFQSLSVGSAAHPNGCQPCIFLSSSSGKCPKRSACQYCHAPHEDMRKARLKALPLDKQMRSTRLQ
mmetsp:Transcript_64584/g.151344  ORF Transcript_64584/g.151344 Transcript_64584/m.151344 type:complete len:335 (+) Transcript_64584:114-1118(+)